MRDPSINKPERQPGDVVHTVAKAVLSAVPYLGGPAAELISLVIASPLEKRRDEWIQSIATGLKRLEERVGGFEIWELSDSSAFITTVLHASRAAMCNHQKEKLRALRNAVLNASLPNAIDEDLQITFVHLVDDLTTWHIRVLEFMRAPGEWCRKNDLLARAELTTFMPFIVSVFPEFRERGALLRWIINDLYYRGLLDSNVMVGSGGPMGEALLDYGSASSTGSQFLAFIASPFETGES